MINSSKALPTRIETPADVAALQSAAQRLETPCDGGSIVWHRWGEGPTTLLLHGGAGSWMHWVRNIAALVADGRTVLVPDMPGFGDSVVPATGHDADAVAPLLELGLTALIGTTACDVVAFSFGGIVASFLLTEHPARARQLVLVGAPALSVEPVSKLGLRPWSHLHGEARYVLHRYNLQRMMLAREESVDDLAIWLHDVNIVRDRLPLRRLANTDIVARLLPRIECPVSGIWGADDRLYQGRIDRIGEALHEARDFRSLTLLHGAGHWVQFEDAAEFNRLLISVLADGARSAPVQRSSTSSSSGADVPKA
ncbi:MAG: alpha/beta fold hydrolase [Ideonella sp.]